MKKNILFVIPTLRIGGAEKSLVNLLKAMEPERCSVDLLLFEGNGALRSEVPEWVNILEADAVTRGMTLEIRWHFKQLLKHGSLCAAAIRLWLTLDDALRKRFNLAPRFGWGITKNYIPSLKGYYDTAIGYLEGTTDFYVIDKVDAGRKIGWIHTDMSGRRSPNGEIAYYKRFDGIAVITQSCLTAFAGCFPDTKDKLTVIENIVLPEEIRAKADIAIETGWDDSKINLVTVGRLDHVKGIDLGIKACAALKRRGISVVWHEYGQGVLRPELEKLIAEYGVSDAFMLEGLVPNPYPYMKRADIIVQSSRYEGKSIVLDEAKILGKAIVVTNYVSVGDQIKNEVTGLIMDMDPEAIADGIERLLHDKALRSRLENNCANDSNDSDRAMEKLYQLVGI